MGQASLDAVAELRMLQVDRHKYVKMAYHGFEPLTREQRRATYTTVQVSGQHARLHVPSRQQPRQSCSHKLPNMIRTKPARCKRLGNSRSPGSCAQTEFDEPDYALIDTLFSLAEAHLFMQLVTLHDRDPSAIPGNKQLADMYRCRPHSMARRTCSASSEAPCMLCILH